MQPRANRILHEQQLMPGSCNLKDSSSNFTTRWSNTESMCRVRRTEKLQFWPATQHEQDSKSIYMVLYKRGILQLSLKCTVVWNCARDGNNFYYKFELVVSCCFMDYQCSPFCHSKVKSLQNDSTQT